MTTRSLLIPLILVLALQSGCAGKGDYCAQVAAVVRPSAAYADETVQEGTPLVDAPAVTANGPIVAATLLAGTLPAGTTLGADGAISGTPEADGVFAFTVRLGNAEGGQTDASGTITVLPAGALALAYPTPRQWPLGQAIPPQTATLANLLPALGVNYAVTSGSLPDGLALDGGTGTLTGTPGTPGVNVFSITVTNGARTASADLSYTIENAGSITLGYPTPMTFDAGLPIPVQTPVLGNLQPGLGTTFALTAGALPPGLVLGPDGSISGTPGTPGTYAFSITAGNGSRTATADLVYTVPAG